MSDDQVKLHPNPLGKPNGLTIEGLARTIAVIENDIKWIKDELQKRNGQIDEMNKELRLISEMLHKYTVMQTSFEEEINEMKESFKDEVDEIKETLKDHEQRIRSTERHDWMEIGVAATLASLLTGGLIMAILKVMGV